MTGRRFAEVHGAAWQQLGASRRFFDELKAHWRSLGADELAGGAIFRSASGAGWSIKVFSGGGEVRAFCVFDSTDADCRAGIRGVIDRHCPVYDPLLQLADERGDAVELHRAVSTSGETAGLLFAEHVDESDVAAVLSAMGFAQDGDDRWRAPDQPAVLLVWRVADRVQVTINPAR